MKHWLVVRVAGLCLALASLFIPVRDAGAYGVIVWGPANTNTIYSWTDLDLSGIVGVREAVVMIKVHNDDLNNLGRIWVKAKGDADEYPKGADSIYGSNVGVAWNNQGSTQVITETNSEGVIQIRSYNNGAQSTSVTLSVIHWWATGQDVNADISVSAGPLVLFGLALLVLMVNFFRKSGPLSVVAMLLTIAAVLQWADNLWLQMAGVLTILACLFGALKYPWKGL